METTRSAKSLYTVLPERFFSIKRSAIALGALRFFTGIGGDLFLRLFLNKNENVGKCTLASGLFSGLSSCVPERNQILSSVNRHTMTHYFLDVCGKYQSEYNLKSKRPFDL